MPTKSKTSKTPPPTAPNDADGTDKSSPLYVAALEQENLKLQCRIAKLEVELASAKNRITALEEVKPEAAIRNLSDAELDALLEEKMKEAGYVKASSQ
jgi:hypothetical protein